MNHRENEPGSLLPAAATLCRGFTFLLGLAAAGSVFSAEPDLAKLPPAATNRIDFARDIKPILDASCLRCHGPEKPKSQFRVDDRAALLRGGENGRDVIPGDSAHSPMIHYVARLVLDLEMPPPGKGEPLTPSQIALLRAWIDQDLPWAAAKPEPRESYDVATTVGWTGVSGNHAQFREHAWQPDGWNGGLERYYFTEPLDPHRQLTLTGRALRDDYKVTLALEQPGHSFVRAGWEQYRKYFNDAGGYYPTFNPPVATLGRDLTLDTGLAWAEAGLAQPGLPQVTVGYEYHYQEGDKSLTQWLPDFQGGTIRNVLPASKHIDQNTHVIRLDATHNVGGFDLADSFRYEIFNLDTRRDTVPVESVLSEPRTRVFESHDSHQWANAFRLEKPVKDWWLVTAGYQYAHADGEASLQTFTFDATGAAAPGYFWTARPLVFDHTAHTFNFNTQLGPWQGLSVSAGLQSEWSWQKGVGDAELDEGFPGSTQPATLDSNLDRFRLEETAGLRFTRIPRTVFFADGRWAQEELGRSEEQLGGNHFAFQRDTEMDSTGMDLRGGFRVTPLPVLSLHAHYRYLDRATDFHHGLDRRFDAGGAPLPGDGYSAFITGRDTRGDEVEAKAVWRVNRWLRTSLSYKVTAQDYHTTTDEAPNFFAGSPPYSPGGRVLGGEYDAHIYSVGATVTPWRRLYLSGSFTFTDSATRAEANDVPAVVPYEGRIYSALAGATYVLNEKTDLQLTYAYSSGDYSQDHYAGGLPLGADYRRHAAQIGVTRRFRERFLVNVRYGFFDYDDSASDHFNDYTAHAVFTTFTVRTP